MKKKTIGFFLLPLIFLTGCHFAEAKTETTPEPQTPPAETSLAAAEKKEKELIVSPEELPSLPSESPAEKEISAAEEKVLQPPLPPPEEKMPMPPPPSAQKNGTLPPPPPRHSPDHYRRGQGLWRAFSQLSDEEKKELLELQRTSPDKFRAVMQEKADRLYEKERARKQQMEEIAKKCRETNDPAEKAKLEAQLRQMVQEDFNAHMQNARRNLNESRNRLQKMEADLARRESNSAAIVDTITQKMLK